jgi:CheY-like chemotaxis protein
MTCSPKSEHQAPGRSKIDDASPYDAKADGRLRHVRVLDAVPVAGENMAISQLPPVRRIALVDDDTQYIRMVERVLFGERTEVVPITTLDIEEAVEIVAGGEFSLVVIDIMMYGNAAGFDVVEQLRRREPTRHVPIVIASGAQREIGRRVDFLREHNCTVLLKPFDPEELIASVRSADEGAGGGTPLKFPSAIPANVRALRPHGGTQPA